MKEDKLCNCCENEVATYTNNYGDYMCDDCAEDNLEWSDTHNSYTFIDIDLEIWVKL